MSKKILIVDDSAAVRKMIELALKSHNYQVIEAKNGVEGVRYAKTEQPDLIILDVNMPIMDGRETLVKLKTYPETSSIPVMMSTSESKRDTVMGLLRSGASDYMVKPFMINQLLQKANSLLFPADNNIKPEAAEHPQPPLPRKNEENPDDINYRLRDKDKQPFTVARSDDVIRVTIYHQFNEDKLAMFEILLETLALMYVNKTVFNISPALNQDNPFCEKIGEKIKWIKESGSSVEIISSGSKQGEDSALWYLRKLVFGKIAVLEERREAFKKQNVPFLISETEGMLFIQLGENVNEKKNTELLEKDLLDINVTNDLQVIFDVTIISILSDTLTNAIAKTVQKLKKIRIEPEFFCDNIEVSIHIQTKIPDIKVGILD